MGSPSITRVVEEAVEREAEMNAAIAFSTVGEQEAGWLRDNEYEPADSYLIADFGEVAVNGDALVPPRMYEILALDRAAHSELWTEAGRGSINAITLLRSWLEQEGYEQTDYGTDISDEEQEVDIEAVVKTVSQELDVRYARVEKAARKLYSEPVDVVSVSGDTELWARPAGE